MKKYIGVLLIVKVMVTFLSCNSSVHTDKSIVGKKIDYFKSYNNKLVYDKTFYLSKSKSLYEYQGDLFKFFPQLSNSDSVEVREVCFNKSSKKLYVWFRLENNTWIVIDNILVSKDVNF